MPMLPLPMMAPTLPHSFWQRKACPTSVHLTIYLLFDALEKWFLLPALLAHSCPINTHPTAPSPLAAPIQISWGCCWQLSHTLPMVIAAFSVSPLHYFVMEHSPFSCSNPDSTRPCRQHKPGSQIAMALLPLWYGCPCYHSSSAHSKEPHWQTSCPCFPKP